MMKRSETNLILVAILSLIGFGYQNCAQSNQSAGGAGIDMASSEIPPLGSQVDPQQMASMARVLKSASSSSSSSSYTVQELETPGATVKEYVSGDGVIFAITWRGLANPDLSQLLGTYFSDYKTEKARQGRVHGARMERVETSNLTVRRAGHMRDLQGQAYDVRLFPAGFSVEDLQ
jgi:hypothetical protein